jgi:CheY-like chemotaxis protein
MLDIGLPDMDGLALLDLLKRTPETRHIPVHVMSADDQGQLGLSMGALGFTAKPVERDAVVSTLADVRRMAEAQERRLILVGGEGEAAERLRAAFGAVRLVADLKDVETQPGERVGCVVAETPGLSVSALVEQVRRKPELAPVVLFAPSELEADDERRLRLAVFAGQARIARTGDQLVDQATMLMHEPLASLPAAARETVARTRRADPLLAGRKALVIDDDIRNIFSLASALEEYGIDLCYAESGRAGLDMLDRMGGADMVLVDIMMPDMDGYETIREIRARDGCANLPVVAVTAKAMKGDRQKCIQAGASDYVAKPVDIDQLISVLRVAVQRAGALAAGAENVVALSGAAGA